MRSVILGLVVIFSLGACGSEPEFCTHMATVEDFSGLDGCGFLLKLDNGEYLQPIFPSIGWCATPPQPEGYHQNSLSDFELRAGQRVSVGYEALEEYGSICMKGKTAHITCLELISEAPVE